MSGLSRSKSDFETERGNMGILKLIQHPNIARLLGAYCHRGKYNFFFQRARGGTLGELIQCDTRPKELQTNTSLILALTGLSSAIQAVHNLTSDKIRMIGCHRDLRLSNILVDGSRFILADFGLSRFKAADEKSVSLFDRVQGDYVAPECEESDRDTALQGLVGRSSDIWSFGCLISELVTYMLRGPKGVKDFRERRRKRIQTINLTHYRFYADLQNHDPSVDVWLASLSREATVSCTQSGKATQGLIQLVRDMLELSPEKRPRSETIENRLRTISIFSLSRQLIRDFDRLQAISSSVHVLLEQRRLQAWIWAINLDFASQDSPFAGGWSGDSFAEFEQICDHLRELQSVLDTLIPDASRRRTRAFLPLRDLNDRLYSLLSETLQVKAREYAEISMLQSDDDIYLRTLAEEFKGSSASGGNLGALAKMKRMRVLTWRRSSRLDLRFHDKLVEVQKIGELRVMKPSSTDNSKAELVVVDTKEHSIKINDQFIRRLEYLAAFLHSIEKPGNYRLLPCRGFYHDLGRFSSSLVYEFPRLPIPQASSSSIVTLESVLTNPEQYNTLDLGDRFWLAHKLALSLLQFHKTAWLHRNIRSSNIIFLHTEDTPFDPRQFYFVGLAHSRQNDPNVHTDGPPGRSDIDHYIDPRYLDTERFQIEYDRYSLGIVLLEIGLWKTLPQAYGRSWEELNEKQARDKTREQLLPRLGPAVGRMYRDAVEKCLEGTFGGGGKDGVKDDVASHLGFATEVVEALGRCCA